MQRLLGGHFEKENSVGRVVGVVARVEGGDGGREKGGRREEVEEVVEEVGTRVEGCGKGREGGSYTAMFLPPTPSVESSREMRKMRKR